MLSVPPVPGPGGRVQLHASTVVINAKAAALVGPAGVGKSSLALQLIQLGAGLISDDITWLHHDGTDLIASGPPTISGQIEARGVGILNAPLAPPAPLALIVDLGRAETDRIPPHRHVSILDQNVALLHGLKTNHFAATIYHYMTHGRAD